MKTEYIVVFETSIGGRLARVEVSTEKDPMNSRTVRSECELIARASFTKLSKWFLWNQAIKAVDIVTIKTPDPRANGN